MSAYCPNRNRKRRLAHGGGSLTCRGMLEVHLAVPIILRVKSMRDPRSPERTLAANILRRGLRVPAPTVRAAFEDPTLRDVVCGACGWSLRRSVMSLSKKRRAA